MMKRHKKGTAGDCSRITPAPTKRPGHHAPTGHPSAKPVGTQKPTQKPTHVPTQMPTQMPSSQPSTAPHPYDLCLDGAVIFDGPGGNGHLYYTNLDALGIYESQLSRGEAILPTCCGGKAAHLATITSDLENDFVSGTAVPLGETVWISLDDEDSFDDDENNNDGTYMWRNGEPVTYRSDVVSQYPAGKCVSFNAGNWTADSCGSIYHGVFEWDCDLA